MLFPHRVVTALCTRRRGGVESRETKNATDRMTMLTWRQLQFHWQATIMGPVSALFPSFPVPPAIGIGFYDTDHLVPSPRPRDHHTRY